MRRALFSAVCTLVWVMGCGSSDPNELTEGYGVKINESRMTADAEGKKLALAIVLERLNKQGPIAGELTVVLREIAGERTAGAPRAVSFRIEEDEVRLELVLDKPDVTTAELGGWLIDYRVKLDGGELFGRRSLYAALTQTKMLVSGDNHFVVDEPAVFRVRLVTTDGAPVSGREASLSFLADADGAVERELDAGKTDERGELLARFTFKPSDLGPGTIKVSAGGHQSSHSVIVSRPRRLMLTTDKPLYQPGQTVFIRALAMRQPALAPVAGEKALIEIEGPQGNKLHRVERETDKHGIVAERFKLARLLNLGEYTLRVTIGDDTVHQKTFRVDRYVLPKFSVTVAPDASFVAPGAAITGEVSASYFFGQPVKAAQVRVTATSASATKVAEVIGKTDDEGRYRFELHPLSGDHGKLTLEAEVTDSTGLARQGRAAIDVTTAKHRLQLVAEPKAPAIGDQVTIFLMLTDPAGKPLSGEVTLTGALDATVQIPASGLAKVSGKVETCDLLRVSHAGRQVYGGALGCGVQGGSRLLLSTDKALYAEGDKATIRLRAPVAVERVTVEVLSRNVPVASETVTLKGGDGKLELPLEGVKLRRTLQLRALAHLGTEALVASRLIFVAGNDQLDVSVSSDQQSYRPGAKAKITLQVKDRSGKPTPAALGVQVVDEALFALSEVKPGVERRYFWLEQEVVDAGTALAFIDPVSTLLVAEPSEADQLRARMLFAAAGNEPRYPIQQTVGGDLHDGARMASRAGFAEVVRSFEQALNDQFRYTFKWPWALETPDADAIRSFGARWLSGRHDPFGQPYRVVPGHRSAQLRSAGMDERFDTGDDITGWAYIEEPKTGGPIEIPMADAGAMPGSWPDAAAAADAGAPPPQNAPDSGASPEPQAKPVRQHFPETLYVDPALITDGEGKAEIDLALADSITSWRLTAIASSQQGQLGSTAAGIKVFTPFFIDVLLPEHLLQNDEVTVPVAVYNYLAEQQQVTVKVDAAPWFELLDGGERQLTLPARAVGSVKFRVRVKQVGKHGFTARGASAADNDAVKRQVRVLPDGVRKEVVFSGTLEPGSTSHTVSFPPEAIDGSLDLFVKVFPGILAEVVEGFESMLAAPHGCFEQTSSTTYPNVMVLAYLKAAKLDTPELAARAEAYIGQGYQALVGYEVAGGGFSLWGDPPAHPTLTAFGLMEFSDMSKVRFVDPALIARTQAWLIAQQQPSGVFPPPSGSAHSIAGGMHDSEVRGTAYTTWALAHSGDKGPAVQKAVTWLHGQAASIDDAYSQAVVANALLAVSPSDGVARQLVAKLRAAANVEGEQASWSSESQSLYHGSGKSMTIETTALALSALLAGGNSDSVVQQGLAFLAANKSSYGGYGSTQATVLALRVLLTALAKQGGNEASGAVVVRHEGEDQGNVTLTPATSELTRYFDLQQVAKVGDNKVLVHFVGAGQLAYQVVGIYYVPHAAAQPSDAPFDFSVSYDRTELVVGQKMVATATVTKPGGGALPQSMIHLGLPPGFTFDEAEVLALNKGVVNNVEQKGPHLVLYLGNVVGSAVVTAPLTATLAVKAKAPASLAYPYYTPEQLRVVETPTVTVVEAPL